MHTVRVSGSIAAPLDEVWAVLDDFGGVSRYNPMVETSRIVGGPATGIGATRECVFYDGGRIEERIVEYESGSSYIVDFVDVGEMLLKSNEVTITAEERNESGTTVTMTATFSPKFGPLGWVMAETMMKSKFRETFEDVLKGLESHALTGQDVGNGRNAEAASE